MTHPTVRSGTGAREEVAHGAGEDQEEAGRRHQVESGHDHGPGERSAAGGGEAEEEGVRAVAAGGKIRGRAELGEPTAEEDQGVAGK